jgi:eukaryotic-like serine/threonine-protein kinase
VSDLPRILGPYRLEKRIGHGALGEVFLARAFGASGFERQIAIKTLRTEHLEDSKLTQMFLEEARLQGQLHHRNLVHAHDCGIDDGVPWVRLDWIDGLSLSQLLERGPLPEDAALFITRELLLGLHALHTAPSAIVHRDVNPSNVLLSRTGDVKLADFGIAKATLLKQTTHAGLRKGTPAFMSPEQARGQPVDPTSDLFSLATLHARMTTGLSPFEGDTVLETLENVRNAKPRDVALRPELLRCWTPNRWPDAESLLRALPRPDFGPLELARLVK